MAKGSEERIGIETIFFNNKIPPLIGKIRENPKFAAGELEELVKDEEFRELSRILDNDTLTAEQILYSGIGRILRRLFFPQGCRHSYETSWRDAAGKLMEYQGASPMNRFIFDSDLLNPENARIREAMSGFAPEAPAEIQSAVNIMAPVGYSRARQVRLRLKSPGSLAFKITNLLYGHTQGEIYDRIGSKVICRDKKTCLRVLDIFMKGIVDGNESISIKSPHKKHVRNELERPDGLNWIRLTAVYENLLDWPQNRIYFSMHIQTEQALELEKRHDIEIGHSQYKKIVWEKTTEKWGLSERRMYGALKRLLRINYEMI